MAQEMIKYKAIISDENSCQQQSIQYAVYKFVSIFSYTKSKHIHF